MSTTVRTGTSRLTAVLRGEAEQVTPLELFFDLVFVLALTQCTALMAAEPTWTGLLKGILILALLWWAWVGYAWLTSVVDPEEGAVRLAFFGAMAGLLIVALCVPRAFEDRALAFAISYGVVRMGHLALYMIASRDKPGNQDIVMTGPLMQGAMLATDVALGMRKSEPELKAKFDEAIRAATSSAAIATNIVIRTTPSSGSTTLVSHA